VKEPKPTKEEIHDLQMLVNPTYRLKQENTDLRAQLQQKEAELETQKRFTEGYLQIMRAWEKENIELQAENARLREELKFISGVTCYNLTYERRKEGCVAINRAKQALSTPAPGAGHIAKMEAVVEATKKHAKTRTTEDFLAVVDALKELQALGGESE
jgi:hypothetical protein